MTKVRQMGRWMYTIDERILEHLSENSWASPPTMAMEKEFDQLDTDEEYIRQRCTCLTERELICPIIQDSDMYEITNLGLAYLRGDLHAGYLPKWPVE